MTNRRIIGDVVAILPFWVFLVGIPLVKRNPTGFLCRSCTRVSPDLAHFGSVLPTSDSVGEAVGEAVGTSVVPTVSLLIWFSFELVLICWVTFMLFSS